MNFDLIEPILYFLGAYLIFIWVTMLIWQVRDIQKRYHSIHFPVVYIALTSILTPFIGIPLYLAFRKTDYAKD